MLLHARTDGVEATQAIASAIARLVEPGDVLLLAGELGAGKTAFAQGFGAGLSVKAPGIAIPKGTRAWEIPDCPELTIAAAWRGKLSPLAEMVLDGLRKRAKAG